MPLCSWQQLQGASRGTSSNSVVLTTRRSGTTSTRMAASQRHAWCLQVRATRSCLRDRWSLGHVEREELRNPLKRVMRLRVASGAGSTGAARSRGSCLPPLCQGDSAGTESAFVTRGSMGTVTCPCHDDTTMLLHYRLTSLSIFDLKFYDFPLRLGCEVWVYSAAIAH